MELSLTWCWHQQPSDSHINIERSCRAKVAVNSKSSSNNNTSNNNNNPSVQSNRQR